MNDQTLETLRRWTAFRTKVLGATRSLRLRTGLRMRCSGVPAWTMLREGSGKVEATRVALVGVFGQRPCQHGVEVREIGSAVRYSRRWRT
jgi:hypothetical protein